jgi:hypothetical protein
MEVWERRDITKLHTNLYKTTKGLVTKIGLSPEGTLIRKLYDLFYDHLKAYYDNKRPRAILPTDQLFDHKMPDTQVPAELQSLCRRFFYIISHQSHNPSFICNLGDNNWPRNVEATIETFIAMYHVVPDLWQNLILFHGPFNARKQLQQLCLNLQPATDSNSKRQLYFLDLLKGPLEKKLRKADDITTVRKTAKSKGVLEPSTSKSKIQRPETDTKWDDVEQVLVNLGSKGGAAMKCAFDAFGTIPQDDHDAILKRSHKIEEIKAIWNAAIIVSIPT